MAEVIDFKTRKSEISESPETEDRYVDEQAVEILEELLERVRSGDVLGFALVGTSVEDTRISAWTRSMFDDPFTYLGMLETLKTRLALGIMEEEEEN